MNYSLPYAPDYSLSSKKHRVITSLGTIVKGPANSVPTPLSDGEFQDQHKKHLYISNGIICFARSSGDRLLVLLS